MLEKTAGMNGTYVLIYTSFDDVHPQAFAGPIPHRLSPVAMLTGSALLSAIGLYALSFAVRLPDRHRRGDHLRAGNRLFLADNARRDRRTVPARRGVPAGPDGVRRQLAVGVVQPWMGGINDQITLAAIPDGTAEPDRGQRASSSRDKVKSTRRRRAASGRG